MKKKPQPEWKKRIFEKLVELGLIDKDFQGELIFHCMPGRVGSVDKLTKNIK